MSSKPSRPFVYLALALVFLLVIGLVVVGVLASGNRSPSAFELTASHIAGTNAMFAKTLADPIINLAATQSRAAVSNTPIPYTADMSPTAAILPTILTRTPIPYTADMSPTAPPYFVYATLTAYAKTATYAARLTSPTPFNTPTYPYDPQLYEMRRREELGLITSGGPTQYAIFYATETALVEAYQTAQWLTATPTPTVSLTPSPTALATFTPGARIQGCVWQWARQDLPELSIKVLQAFIDMDMPQVEVRAEAYGENCLDPNNTGTIQYFAAMTTDFYLMYPMDDLSDSDALAEFVVSAYNVVMELYPDGFLAHPGYLDITFTADSQSKRLRTMFDDMKAALDEGLAGARLLEALGGVR